VVSLVTDGPPGTVPDLRGLSARDAVRKLVKLGMNARATGDGFVISQTPEPGAPIDGDSLCRLVLERRPPRHGATASRP
jgi:beta-lactam-binding protein with PASTA domain